LPERPEIPSRTLQAGLEALLLVACAVYWFGNTGFGLALLWLATRRLPGRCTAPNGFQHLRPICVTAHRVLLRAEDGRRIEIFRDEMTPAGWAALKRSCFSRDLL
jgi:hypothetical protein